MNNDMERRIIEIDSEIKSAEGQKIAATILIIISFFCLWPLLIVGIIMHCNANSKINKLNDEKKQIMFMNYYNKNIS